MELSKAGTKLLLVDPRRIDPTARDGEGPKFLRGGNKQTPVAASGGLTGDPVLLVRQKE